MPKDDLNKQYPGMMEIPGFDYTLDAVETVGADEHPKGFVTR